MIAAWLAAAALAQAPTLPLTIDLSVGSSAADVRAAVTHACAALRSRRTTDATVRFAAGVHEIDMGSVDGGALLNVTACATPPGSRGRLSIAGFGMDRTRLVLETRGQTVLEGKGGWSNLTVRDLTFSRPRLTTTQGRVVAATETHLMLSITATAASRLPPVGALFVDRIGRLQPEQGLYLRRFRLPPPAATAAVGNTPQLITDASNGTAWPPVLNAQVHFACGGDGETCPDVQAVPAPNASANASASLWRLRIPAWPAGERARYAAAALDATQVVAVKVKHGGQAYYLRDGGPGGLAFQRVRWLRHSRGVIINTSNVLFRDTRVEHDAGGGVALATPGGGPQITAAPGGTATSVAVHNVTVHNHTSVGTGDDALGLFGIASGSVRGCNIRDSFARGILLSNCSDAFVNNVQSNVVLRCPVYRTEGAAVVDNV